MRSLHWLPMTVILILLGMGLLLLVGCDQATTQPTEISTVPSTEPTASAGTSEARPTAGSEEATPPVQVAITLTIWTTDAFSPTQAITSGQILAQQVAVFEAARPDVQFEFIPKRGYHEGGLKEYLLNTGAVVPELLPDLVFIDADELEDVVRAGLVQPLDDLVATELERDLYPFAREACTFDGRLYCLPFRADLDHLVFNQGMLESAPSSMPGVLAYRQPYIFPAGGREGLVNDAFLIQYLDTRQLPAVANPKESFLEVNSLVATLQFYEDGGSRGIIPAQVLEYETVADCWTAYLAQEATLAQVSAHIYLTELSQAPNTAVAAIPGNSGPAPAIGRTWVLALVTANPARQAIALEFVDQMMAPEVSASWNWAAGYLPTRQAALANWDSADVYTPFIRQRLLEARPRPRFLNYVQVMGELQTAVEGVLSGMSTAEQAAAQVIENTQ
jgi:ABC-type glycerol-3-phosphate transport system substrate-binding protein